MSETIETVASTKVKDDRMPGQRYYAFWSAEDHQKLRAWWASLKSNPGWRAELRRAESPGDVLLSQGFRYLCFELAGWWTQEPRLLGLAAVAGILSHVEINEEVKSFAAQCATPGEKNEDKPQMSELRFSQLQKSRTIDELYIRMVRAVRLLGKKANIISIADGIFHWTSEMMDGEIDNDPRKRILVRWGLDYFQAIPVTKNANK
jgi:CRISPR system Cascade subunit CasB